MNKSFEAILKLLGQGLAYNKYYKIKIRTYKHTYTETFILSNWMVNCVNSAQESLCLIIFLCLVHLLLPDTLAQWPIGGYQ